MKHKLIIIVLCLIPSFVQAQDYAKYCEQPWKSKRYPYLFCNPQNGRVSRACAGVPNSSVYKRVTLQPLKWNGSCIEYEVTNEAPPVFRPQYRDFYTDELVIKTLFDPHNVKQLAEQALARWRDICPQSDKYPSSHDCCLKIVWTTEEDDFGGRDMAEKVLAETKLVLKESGDCSAICDSFKIYLNNTPAHTTKFSLAGPEIFRGFISEVPVIDAMEHKYSNPQHAKYVQQSHNLLRVLTHEIGHALGFAHPNSGSTFHCKDYAANIQDGGMMTSISNYDDKTNGTLTEADKAIYAKLYCCPITTSVEEEIPPVEFSVTPNPTSEVLHITLANHVIPTKYSVRLVDIQGRNALQKSFSINSSWTLNISTIPTGIYVLELRNEDGGNQSMKVVIER
jgi:hypothetical protein